MQCYASAQLHREPELTIARRRDHALSRGGRGADRAGVGRWIIADTVPPFRQPAELAARRLSQPSALRR